MKHHRPKHRWCCLAACLGLLAANNAVAQTAALQTGAEGVYGELRQWHRVTLAFEGPTTNENANPNPFTNFRLDVTFTHSGGRTITVPGYYAAGGGAGEFSGTGGNIWRAHFTPPLTGTWTYNTSFTQGNNVAINGGGTPNNTINGKSGTLNILATNKTGRDFRAHGRLRYVDAHHLQHEGSGRWFFKFGPDSPENFFAYTDFDNTPSSIPGVRNTGAIHTWQPHVVNWNTGDPQWKGTQGRGAIGAINYLANQGCNTMSSLTYTIDGGDDGRTFPWIGPGNKFRYDCSKLDQWEIIFQHANNRGLNFTVKLAEEENWEDINGSALTLYYREMVARFGHHLGITWVISEEFAGFSVTNAERQEAQRRGDLMANIDPWDNNIVIHTGPGQKNSIYPSLTGRAAYTGASLQIGASGTTRNVFNETLQWRNASAAAGQPWVVACDEQGPANQGVLDQIPGERKNTIWGNFMAGGAGCEFYVNQNGSNLDASLNDYRRIATMWNWADNCVNDFIYANNIPFWEMANANNLVPGNINQCLAKPGDTYVVYLFNGGTTNLNLNGQTGNFQVRWFNPRTGGNLQTSNITNITGGGNRALGSPPNTPGQDWAVLVRRAGGTPPPPPPPPTAQGPFGGTSRTLTNIVQAEDFDTGGQGVAYNDTDASNNGNSYRSNLGVDIQATTDTGGGFNIGWTAANEWLEYTVNIPAGNYTIQARTAALPANPGDLRFELNGTNLGTVPVDSTGGWQTWETSTLSNVTVPATTNGVLRVNIVGGSFNLNWFRFVPATTSPPPPPPGNGNFIEQNGLLVMEAESANLPANWARRTTVPPGDPDRIAGFTGQGFIEWTGAQFFGLQIPVSQANGIITYTFTINNPGIYSFRWRTKQKDAGQTFDAGNDSFVRFASGTNPSGAEDFGTFTKVFIQNKTSWDLAVRAEPRVVNGQAVFINNNFRRQFAAGTHTLQIAARSPGHVIDRIILHRSDVPFNANTFATAPESPRQGTNPPPPPPPAGGDGSPFTGGPYALSNTTIEAENFNFGSNGQSYSDTTPGNEGNSQLRNQTDVDIADGNATDPARLVGWIANGEFWKYAVTATAGNYNIQLRAASNAANPGDLNVDLNGIDLGTFPITNTGGWRDFQVFTLPNVSVGSSNGNTVTLKLTAVNGGFFNLDWIRFVPVGGGNPLQTVSSTPSDDSFLQGTTNIGGNLLRIQPAGPTRETYLKFNVTGAGANLTGSKLVLTVAGDAGNGTVSVFRGATNSWNENNLSGGNAPARGALIGSTTGTFGIGNEVEVDLGTSIGNGVTSLIVVLNAGGNDLAFSSKEGANAPRLEVTSQ